MSNTDSDIIGHISSLMQFNEAGVIKALRSPKILLKQFVLLSNQSLTIEEYGRFKKKAFIAGDKFAYHRVYSGKTGSTVFVFTQIGKIATSKQYVEIKMTDIVKVFGDSFLTLAHEILSKGDLQERAEEIKAEREKFPDIYANNPLYGSW